jgi:hypothetical protein
VASATPYESPPPRERRALPTAEPDAAPRPSREAAKPTLPVIFWEIRRVHDTLPYCIALPKEENVRTFP